MTPDKPTSTILSSRLRDIAIILLFSAVLVSPIALFGIPDNYDLMQHMRFAETFSESLASGSITPAWAAQDNMGFGSIGVRVYPPLLYVATSLFYGATSSWFHTLWLALLFWMIIGSIGTYYLAREWVTSDLAVVAAIAYGLAPYHLFQVYQAFLLAEFTASAILPFCFLFAYRLIKHGGVKNIILFSVFYSLLILSHIPSTLIGTICLGIFGIFLLDKSSFFVSVRNFAAAFAISFAATGFYILRLVTEMNWTKHSTDRFYGSGFYNYSSHLFPNFLYNNSFYYEKLMWSYDLIVVLSALLILPLILLVLARKLPSYKNHRGLYSLFLTTIFALFMLSLPSSFIWDNITLLQKIQFPWRWLTAATLTGSVIFTICLSLLKESKQLSNRLVSYSLIAGAGIILLFNITQIILPSAPIPKAVFNEDVAKIHEEAGCECWWPVWAKADALGDSRKVTVENRSVEIAKWDNTDRKFYIAAGEAGMARIATFYYPYWTSEVNGSAVEVSAAEDGTILIPIPSEQAEVRLFFDEPAFLITSKYVSLTAWLLLIIALIATSRRLSKHYQLV